MVNRPAWTISEAVERTGASRSTIRRYRDAGKFPSAFKDSAGVWRVPIEDLLAAGLSVNGPARLDQVNQVSEHASPIPEHVAETLREKVNELERALAVEQAKNEGLTRAAAAAEQNARDLRQALRMLEVGRSEQVQSEQVNRLTEHRVNKPADQPLTMPAGGPEQPIGAAPRSSWLSRFKRLKS